MECRVSAAAADGGGLHAGGGDCAGQERVAVAGGDLAQMRIYARDVYEIGMAPAGDPHGGGGGARVARGVRGYSFARKGFGKTIAND